MLLEFSGWDNTGPLIFDLIILVILLTGIVRGFLKGFVTTCVSFVEGLLVVLVAVFLKNPISVFFYKHLPFFGFKIQVFNVILYEFLAFLLVIAFLVIILVIINKFIRIIEKLFSILLGIGIPNGIMGAIVSLLQYFCGAYILIFIVFFCSALTGRDIDQSFADKIFYNTPVLKDTILPPLESCIDIAKTAYNNDNDKVVDYKSLDILLKHKVITPENAKYLVDNNKLKIDGSEKLINKYS